ncbi:hypothetical protein ID866_13259 [Astraeus odoratus]|nr:hypothetical protein ID866_13259 [Astraeus odoratus]
MYEVLSRPSRQTFGYDLNVHGSDRGDYLKSEAEYVLIPTPGEHVLISLIVSAIPCSHSGQRRSTPASRCQRRPAKLRARTARRVPPSRSLKLDEVTRAVDVMGSVPEGCETWVRPTRRTKAWGRKSIPSQPVVCWVNHRYHRILTEMPTDDFTLTEEDEREC